MLIQTNRYDCINSSFLGFFSPSRSSSNGLLCSTRRKIKVFYLIALCLLPQLPTPLSAEEPESYTEIIVNGANVESPLLEVPSSTTVLTTKELESTQSSHLDDVIELAPNLNTSAGTNRTRFFQIRGIGEREQFEGSPNSSVGLAIDDINLSGIGGVSTLFDIEQVEILRGPQGLRFGANALAGFINLRSQPAPRLESSQAKISVGDYGLVETGVATGGPITTNGDLRFRLSTHWHESDGFTYNNYFNSPTNGREEFAMRGQLIWDISNQTEVTINTLHFNFNNGFDGFSIFNGYETYSDNPGEDDQITTGMSAVVNHRLDSGMRLRAITSNADSSLDYRYDGDWGNNAFWGDYAPYDYFSSTDRTRRTLSQEIRLLSDDRGYTHGENDRWFIGGYTERLTERGTTEQLASGERYDSLESDYQLNSFASFGQYEFALGNEWSIASGLRAEQANSSYVDNRGNSGGPDNLMMGGNLTLERSLSPLSRWYTTFARGYKGGGVNVSLGTPEDHQQFDPEYLWNLESGIKSRSSTGETEGTLSAFYSDRENQQILYSTQIDPSDPLSYIYITDNAARGFNTGVEGELIAKLSPSTTVISNFALLYSEVTEAPEELTGLEGRQQPHAPNWQYHLGMINELGSGLFSRIDLTGRDRFYFDTSHNERSAVTHQVNMSFGFRGNSYSLTLWGRNVFDDNEENRGFYFGNEPPDYESKRYVQLGERANFGVTFVMDL